MRSLGLLVIDVLTAATTELLKLESFRRSLLILRSHIVATLTLCTLQYDVITRHNSNLQLQISNQVRQTSLSSPPRVETLETN